MTLYVLQGLNSEYKEIKAAVKARDSLISFEERHNKLIDHENGLQRDASKVGITTITTNYVNKSGSSHKSSSNNNLNRFGSSSQNNHSSHTSNQQRGTGPPRNQNSSKSYRGYC